MTTAKITKTPSRVLLAKNLRILRAARDWSQIKLSENSGVDAKYIVGLEAGKRKPSLDTLDKLALAFGLAPFELLQPRDKAAR